VSRRAALAAGAGTALAAAGIGVWRVLAGGSEPAGGPRVETPARLSGPSATASKQNTTKAKPSATTAPVLLGGGPVPGVRGRALLGAYLDLSGMNLAQAVALRRRQLGRDERIMHAFYEWTDLLPTSVAGAPATAVPMISWRGTYHADILSGKYDAHIAVNARRLAGDRRPKFLRWGWEMNGNWYAWSGPKNGNDPAGYIACWKRIHQIFANEGADNVSWVWSVNWNSAPDTPQNAYAPYYPGDKFVDWVGISGYNLHHEAPATLFDGLYEEYAARKPMMISEVGSVDYGGTTKGDWVRDFAAYVGRRPNIAAVCWFDTDTHRNYSETWRIDTNPNALAAYRLMARGARFSG
jgi:hypothetical protein